MKKMAISDEVEVKVRELQITQDTIYWIIAAISALILVVLGIIDVIAYEFTIDPETGEKIVTNDFINFLDINDFIILAIIVIVGVPKIVVQRTRGNYCIFGYNIFIITC